MTFPRSILCCRSLMAAAMLTALPLAGVLAACEEEWVSAIAGVYVLQEWHTEAGVLKPPAVDGRFVLKDGAVVTIIQNMSDAAKQTALALFGEFRAEGCKFFYRYNNRLFVTETPAGATVSRTLPWEGLREFAVTTAGKSIIFRTVDGEHEFNFSPKELRYSE